MYDEKSRGRGNLLWSTEEQHFFSENQHCDTWNAREERFQNNIFVLQSIRDGTQHRFYYEFLFRTLIAANLAYRGYPILKEGNFFPHLPLLSVLILFFCSYLRAPTGVYLVTFPRRHLPGHVPEHALTIRDVRVAFSEDGRRRLTILI